MADYIDRQAALDAVCDLPTWYGDAGCLPFGDPQPPMEALMYPEDVVSAINNLPSADVEEVRHGRWVTDDLSYNVYCSECKMMTTMLYNFCPWCGARMNGEQDEL